MKKKKQKSLSLIGIVDVITIGLAIATLFGFLGRFHWFLDLFSHFRVQYMQLCLVSFFIAMWKRRNKRAVALVLLVCLNYALVLPLYIGKPAPATGNPYRAMLMNINAGNGNTERSQILRRLYDPPVPVQPENVDGEANEERVQMNPLFPPHHEDKRSLHVSPEHQAPHSRGQTPANPGTPGQEDPR